ncbi:hypothetical protein [Streptomyces sp. T028]|uniref:hypothetical protein n=1 Tax=Streptomyces sp. T028 TaxID=3394379 RepID=UPI003A8AE2C9
MSDDWNTPQPRLFVLQRDTDVTGVSGPGPVADGVLWPDGTVVLRWRERPSTSVWDSLDLMLSVHGHDGATRAVWADEDTVPVASHLEAGERAQKEIERLRATAGRAYLLADRWEAAHGASQFLVRAAGAELRDELDGAAQACGEECAEGHVYAGRCEKAAAGDLSGYYAPDPPIGCLNLTQAAPDTRADNSGPTIPNHQVNEGESADSPADTVTDPAWLREQYATAITAEHYRRAREQIVASPEEHSAAMADAVMGVRDRAMDTLHRRVAFVQEMRKGGREQIKRLRAELQRYTEAESADAAAGSYAHRAEQAEDALTEAQQLVSMMGELIGAERRIVSTAMVHRDDQGVRVEACDGCGRDHMAELEKEIREADKAYAEVFPAAADGPARPGRLPESAVRTPRQRAYEAVNAYIESLGDRLPTTRAARTAHIWLAVNRALDAAGHAAAPETLCRLPHEMEA